MGVHTPLDVGVAVLVTVPVCLLVDWMLATLERPGRAKLYAWLGVLAALALMGVGLARVCLSNVPEEQAADSFKTGGAALGFLLSLYLDRRFIRFQVKARFWQQAIKLVVGVALALLLKEGLKSLLGVGLAMQASCAISCWCSSWARPIRRCSCAACGAAVFSVRPLDAQLRQDVLNLRLYEHQKGYVEPVAQCLQEAESCRFFEPAALLLEGKVVGFAMYGEFPNELGGQARLARPPAPGQG